MDLHVPSSSAVSATATTSHSHIQPPAFLSPENVASVPPPGLSAPSQPVFLTDGDRVLLSFVTVQPKTAASSYSAKSRLASNSFYRPLTTTTNGGGSQVSSPAPSSTHAVSATERVLLCWDVTALPTTAPQPLLRWRSRSRAVRRPAETEAPPQNGQSSADATLPMVTSPPDQRRDRVQVSSSAAAAGSLTQFHWVHPSPPNDGPPIRLLIPVRGSLYIQNGLDTTTDDACVCIHDKSATGLSAMDAQLSPDGSMVAWTCDGELYVQSALTAIPSEDLTTGTPPIRVSFGAVQSEAHCISHGVADFVAQEEMDRYRGFWWHPHSTALLFTRTDESAVPLYRILHQSNASTLPSSFSSAQNDHSSSQHYYDSANSSCSGIFAPTKNTTTTSAFEDHRYPFAGKKNPSVQLGLVQIDRDSVLNHAVTMQKCKTTPASSPPTTSERRDGIECEEEDENASGAEDAEDAMHVTTAQDIAAEHWANCVYFDAPTEAHEYLARVHVLPEGRAIVQWQNRSQSCSVLYLLDLNRPPLTDGDKPDVAPGRVLLVERSDVWINLHHMFHLLPRPIHPKECRNANGSPMEFDENVVLPQPLPAGSFSFLFASEKTEYAHLYLYTYSPGVNGDQAVLIKPVTSGNWTVESILGVDLEKDVVYFAGSYDSILERHLYSLPILNVANQHTWRYGAAASAVPHSAEEMLHQGAAPSSTAPPFSISEESSSSNSVALNGSVRRGLSKVMHAFSGKGNMSVSDSHAKVEQEEIYLAPCNENRTCPTRLTLERGMHSIVMDEQCRYFVDTSSDLDRPTTVKIYELPTDSRTTIGWKATLYNASYDDASLSSTNVANTYKTNGLVDMVKCLPAPELISFPTSDGTETLHAALYRPNPLIHGPGPYPLVCAVYGGPHVQRVNRSWSQSADMRAQRLRSLGFCVVKCDNRGSSRRGLVFESAIARRLGRIEVLDQVAAVRQLVMRGIVDPTRVGVYGWSYGGYLSAMCLCRAPDVFHVAVAGAPVTSWDGYDTHYTERYMGLPADNPSGYRESAVFDHVPNMRGKLMIVHGLIDENVHFRHTTRLINKLIAAGKDYDLLIFPEERHSPRRLRDRIYMEQRISDFFVRHLSKSVCHLETHSDTATYSNNNIGNTSQHGSNNGGPELRPMAGHL
jgi:dienelactone hydrolase